MPSQCAIVLELLEMDGEVDVTHLVLVTLTTVMLDTILVVIEQGHVLLLMFGQEVLQPVR